VKQASYIAGDWGTSHLRLMLCDVEGFCIESREGPGAAASRGKFPETLELLTADWQRVHGDLPVVLCGMVGSSIGWIEAPYLPCPAKPDVLAGAVVVPRGRGVSIVPGLSCTNPHGAPDVLRGEETQLLGALALEPALGEGRKLVCLPGTHTKWLWLDDGVVRQFLTAPTGELFGLLVDHSVLVRDRDTPVAHIDVDFKRGVADAAGATDASLLHRLFESRSRRMAKLLTPEGAASWTSGLLIGSDVTAALKLARDVDAGAITVIGTPTLTGRYAEALKHAHRAAHCLDGAAAAQAGLTRIRHQLARVVL
jgi:2-dehydro-3-deoxygalactonokinase